MAVREAPRVRVVDGVGGARTSGAADVAERGAEPAVTVAAGRAAQQLELRRGEFELAVHLGLIGVTVGQGGGRPRVRSEEIGRLRAQAGFPEVLRDRVRTLGTAEGAGLLGISPVRFTRLARVGCFSPVSFYLNRYRAVVWLYLAEDLARFAIREPGLLAGKSPVGMRTMLTAGTDWRARNWRTCRIDRLLSSTEDPWVRASVEASALDPVQLAEVVDDPYERAYLVKARPEPVFGRPGSVSGREIMAQLMLADDPDEILWRRISLALELDRAREARPAPRPGEERDGSAMPRRAGAPKEGATEAVWRGPAGGFTALGEAPEATPAPDPLPERGTGPGLLTRLGLRRRVASP
ncbi:DUF6397 family protein [Streptomyces fulvorobeus]|uniref:Uncharacterized protein n=1 Tax=Streptomyces fulvorobeus TaxID=284028 RepID=A0A7J0CFG5_9ACTN|nr:DUF6397 family protein [Streptomyces fulvorobeus]NYE44453.1 hypothetical protein [Streptomyces fulvorobeus]GFN00988.1 hypothetical protein Sfulv_57980 [Streptomyces fulvorobeus]